MQVHGLQPRAEDCAECGNGQGMAHLPRPMHPRYKHTRCWCTGAASPPALWTTALLVTPTFQLLYLHSWKITMPMSFRAGPAGAKGCHERDGREHFPVLCHGSVRMTLDSATEQHWAKSLQLSFPTDGMRLITSWWLLRQVDGYNCESCNQLASPLDAQKSREVPAPGHTVKGAWDGEDHNTLAQRLSAGPSCGP